MKIKKLLGLLPLCICSLFTCNTQSTVNTEVSTPADKSVPHLYISTKQKILDDPKRKGVMKVLRNDSVLTETHVGIELRGAVSQAAEKKSYNVECRNQQGKALKISLLGMPADEDWVLYGPMTDRSLIRNALAYTLSNLMGRYAARWKFVELSINNDYKGLYLLMEKLKRHPQRIAISKLEKTDSTTEQISGGYILKLDKTAGSGERWDDYTEQNSFRSIYDMNGRRSVKSRINYLYDYPKAKKLTPPQRAYIQQYVHNFESTMASAQFKDPTHGYAKYIDVPSFVDYFILTEFMQNHDGYRISTYLQKDKHGKLMMGPIWDCDLGFGPDQAFCEGMSTHAWVYRYNQYCGYDSWLVPFWWERLMQDPTFKAQVVQRWQQLRLGVLSDAHIEQQIEQLTQYLHKHQLIDRNYERWSERKQTSPKERHQKHIAQLRMWTLAHAAWLDKAMLSL